MKLRTVATALLLTVAAGHVLLPAQARPAPRPATPKLAVIIVVDQMRGDYVNLYGHQWTKGLRRLYDTGAAFVLAEYPYAYTVTCAGHATISTGAFPSTHGMVGNAWLDRESGRNIPCTDDQDATAIPFGGAAGTERHGPRRLLTTTLSDEIRLQSPRPATVAGVSLKPRSAISLAGHASPTTYAVWTEDSGAWSTSTAYTATAPQAIDTWAATHQVSSAYGHVWERLRPESSYLFADDAPGEPSARRIFPHTLTSRSGKPDNSFATSWKRSPLGDAAVSSLAQHMVRTLKLGQADTGFDFLGVSFSSLDFVGHAFGPHSHEVQDLLMRLDESIGALLDTLDAVVGKDQYVVALSADHGVAPMPEEAASLLHSAGRWSSTTLRNAINTALTPVIGEGLHVRLIEGAHVYFTPEALPRVLSTPGAREAVTQAIKQVPGADLVYWADELGSRHATSDPYLEAARRSYHPDRAGDLFVFGQPFWIRSSAETSHGTPYGYDRRVPVVFAGAGIAPGRYLSAASPADIAPTLAAVLGITMARPDGRVLTDALR